MPFCMAGYQWCSFQFCCIESSCTFGSILAYSSIFQYILGRSSSLSLNGSDPTRNWQSFQHLLSSRYLPDPIQHGRNTFYATITTITSTTIVPFDPFEYQIFKIGNRFWVWVHCIKFGMWRILFSLSSSFAGCVQCTSLWLHRFMQMSIKWMEQERGHTIFSKRVMQSSHYCSMWNTTYCRC